MDWVLISIGIIFALCILWGLYQGAIKITVSLATTVLTLIIVFFATPFAAKYIAKFTPADELVHDKVVASMTHVIDPSGSNAVKLDPERVGKVLLAAGYTEEDLEEYDITVEDIADGLVTDEELAKVGISSTLLAGLREEAEEAAHPEAEEDEMEEEEIVDIPRDMQVQAIEAADLPDLFKSLLTTNNNSEIYNELGVETFIEYAATYMAKLIINIVAFLCTFLVVTIVLRAIIFALDVVSDLPMLGFLNHMAGGAVGFVVALTIVWTLFIALTLLYSTEIGKHMYQSVMDNSLLAMIYDNNPIMNLAIRFR